MGRPELGSSASVSRDLYSLHAPAYDLQLTESVDALVTLLELAGLDLDADGLQLVVKVRDGVLRAGIVPDDEAAQGLAGLAAPGDCTLTLVRDTCVSCEKARRLGGGTGGNASDLSFWAASRSLDREVHQEAAPDLTVTWTSK